MDKIEALIRGLITEEQYKTIEGNTITRVRVVSGNRRLRGSVGTVLGRAEKQNLTLVQFDEPMSNLHNGSGKGKENQCWYCQEKQLEDVGDEDG